MINMISRTCSIIVIVTAIIAIMTAYILSGFFRKALFDYSAQFIYDFQQPPSQAGKVIFNLIEIIGEIYVVGPIFALIYLIIYRKLNGLVYLVFMGLNIFLIAVIKHAFQDPRPFWQYDFIQLLQWSCLSQYGYPSGHAWISVLLFEPIISDFVGLGPFRWAMAAVAFTGSLIPLSRLYLGVHSIDQILTGLLLSFSVLILYRFKLQKLLFKFLYLCLNAKKYGLKLILPTIFTNILFIITPIIIFEINTNSRIFDEQLFQGMNESCDSNLTHFEHEGKHGIQAAVGCAIFGAFYGLMGTSFTDNKQWWISYYFGQWKYEQKRNIVFKLALYILCTGFSAGIFIVLIPNFIQNFYGKYLISVFGIMLTAFSLSFIVPLLAHRFKIIFKKDPKQERTHRLPGAQVNQKYAQDLQKIGTQSGIRI